MTYRKLSRFCAVLLTLAIIISSFPAQALGTIDIEVLFPEEEFQTETYIERGEDPNIDDIDVEAAARAFAEMREAEYEIIEEEPNSGDSMSISPFSVGSIDLSDFTSSEVILSKAFKTSDSTSEQISYSDGSLIYNAVDLELPGVNGLDLVISRQYNSSKANYFTEAGALYYKYDMSSHSYLLASAYMTRERETYNKNSDGSVGDFVSYSSKYYSSWGDTYSGRLNRHGFRIEEDTSSYVLVKDTYGYYSPNSSYPNLRPLDGREFQTPYDDFPGIGTGWSLNFPFIDADASYPVAHLPDGTVISKGLYYTKDIVFTEDQSFTLDSVTSQYSIAYKNGKTEYFDSNGRIMARVDKYGNSITFKYSTYNNKPQILITDSTGRLINLYCEDTASGYNMYIELPDSQRITYTFEVGYTFEDDTPNSLGDPDNIGKVKYNLTSVTDLEGNTTLYDYETKSAPFSYGYHLGYDYTYENYYAALSQITYPSGLTSSYVYYTVAENWGLYGFKSGISLKLRYDHDGADMFNDRLLRYSYSINGAELDKRTKLSYNISENGSGITTKYYFNSRGRNTSIEKSVNNVLIESTDLEYTYLNPWTITNQLLSKETTTIYGQSSQMTVINCYEYDLYANVIAHWPPTAEGNTSNQEYKYVMEYTQPYNLLTSYSYKKDNTHTIKAEYIPTTDGKSIEWQYLYDNNQLKEKTQYVYDSYGNITDTKQYILISGSDYAHTKYYYDNGANLIKTEVLDVRDSDGASLGNYSKLYGYDWYGRIIKETDGNGNEYNYTYDNLGKITSIVNPDNTSITYSYNYSTNTLVQTDEAGHSYVYKYDGLGDLISVTDMASGQLLKTYEYDEERHLITESTYSSANKVTTTNYTYDYYDRVAEISISSGGANLYTERYSYEDAYSSTMNKATKTVVGDSSAPSVITTSYSDKIGRTVQTGVVLNGTEHVDVYKYDYVGNMVSALTALGASKGLSYTTKWENDYAGRTVKEYNALGFYATTEYDALGRATAFKDFNTTSSGGTYATTYTYDKLGRLLSVSTPFESSGGTVYYSVSKTDYDAVGNVIRERTTSNVPGQTDSYTQTEYAYDSRNRLISAACIDSGGSDIITEYEYDRVSNLIKMYTGLPGDAAVTSYAYDVYGNITSMTDPLGQAESYTYDLLGNMLSKTDRNGALTEYTYDGLSRSLSRTVTDDGVTQTEDQGYTLTGQLSNMSNDNISISYTYNGLGLVTTETGSDGVVNTYGYDIGGNLTSSTAAVKGSAKKNLTYEYDRCNRLYKVYESGSLIATYGYDANGNRNSLVYSNGVTTTYAYNLANLVTSLQNKNTGGTLSGYTYTYYLDGNQQTKVENGTKVTAYTYDGVGRLTMESESGTADAITKGYSFDAAGNRSMMTVSGAEEYSVSYSYDKNNRLLTSVKDSSTVQEVTDYYYDPNGNTISTNTGIFSDGETDSTLELATNTSWVEIFSYDGFNRQVGASVEDGDFTYTYRPDGLRLSKTVDGETTYHVWEGQNMSMELDGDGTVIDVYIRGINLIKSGNNGWYLYNAHGDVVQLTNSAGTVTKTYDYDAFGNERDPDAEDTNPFRYCGEYYDKETGTYYLRARYYNPVVGRFTQQDTHWNPSNMIYGDDPLQLNRYTYLPNIQAIIQCGSLYAYTMNNPIFYIDPTGYDGQTISLGSGWYYRIDSAVDSTGTQRHIHIWNDNKNYAQNEDGSPHDKNNNSSGKPPNWVLKEINKKEDWDYKALQNEFFDQTVITAWDVCWYLEYADGTKAYVSYYQDVTGLPKNGISDSDIINAYMSAESSRTPNASNPPTTGIYITPIIPYAPVITMPAPIPVLP